MRRITRLVAGLLCLVLVAAACSKPKKDEEVNTGGQNEGVSALDTTETTAAASDTTAPAAANPNAGVAAPSPGAGKTVKPGATGYAALNPNANTSQAKKVGSLIKPQSTAYSNPVTWTGVTQREIKVAFSYDERGCGVNVLNAASQAGGNLATEGRYYRGAPRDQQTQNAETREAIDAIVRYWNDNIRLVADDIPAVKPAMDKYNVPGHNLYGRKLVPVLVDGGSFQCPDTTTAGAVRITQEVKPFVVFTNDVPSVDGSGFNMASALNAKAPANTRPMHFGPMWLSDKYYSQWAPFVWTQFNSGTMSAIHMASWMCARLNGKPAVNSPQFRSTPRKFGLAYPNTQNAKLVISEFKAAVEKDCGKQVISSDAEFAYSTDVSRAGDEATQMMVKMKLAGVTSVINFLDLFFPLFQIAAAKGQDYRPEWLWPGNAYTDSNTLQRLYDQEMVDKASFGISAFGQPGGFGYEGGDPFFVWNYSHKVSPTTKKACDPSSAAGMDHDPKYCKAPGAIVTWYYTVLPFVGGSIFAGPDLKPINVTKGLQAYPETRYGGAGPTDDPRTALVGAGPGQYFFIIDSSEWRYRRNFRSPPPESKLGWVEYPDCQRHYIRWPDQLAKQWEKNGPNYGAWCGDPKYAPADSPEKDGYPRLR